MKIQRPLILLIIGLYIAVIYFSPPLYTDRPKFLILKISRLPLVLTRNFIREVHFIFKSRDIIKENASLYDAMSRLTCQMSLYKDVEAENERLRSMLGFKQRSNFKLIPAAVIAADSSNLSRSIVINKGVSDGIKKDTIVISQAGLAGRVIDSSSDISRVSIITAPYFRASCIISRSRQIGIVYGGYSGMCRMRYIPLDADIKEGDEVLTSGLSDVYPKGLIIGAVSAVIKEPRGLSLSAVVKPATDFARLEEVLCIE
ncbi:MAG: rod shape-determining protein MreC [Candidatus Omnitrophota bacterium]